MSFRVSGSLGQGNTGASTKLKKKEKKKELQKKALKLVQPSE